MMAKSATNLCHHVTATANAVMRAAGIIIGMVAPVRRLAQRASQLVIYARAQPLLPRALWRRLICCEAGAARYSTTAAARLYQFV